VKEYVPIGFLVAVLDGSPDGLLGETWALAKDAKKTDTIPRGTTTRAMDRNIENSPTSPGGQPKPLLWSTGRYSKA
jgi:hypothetical protein